MTTSGHRGDQGGEQGGAMDKLKSVWREAVGSRDDDEARAEGNIERPENRRDSRADTGGDRPEPSGTAHPADVRPDISARAASGIHPADSTGPVAQQSPQYETPQRAAHQGGPGPVPRQQQAPAAQAPQAPGPEAQVRQEQTVAAGAQGAPARGATQAPPAPAGDDRAQQQVPRQAAPPQGPTRPAVPQQTSAAPEQAGKQSAPRESGRESGWSEPDRPARTDDGGGGATTTGRRDDEAPVRTPDSSSAADTTAADTPAADTPAADRGADGRTSGDVADAEKTGGRHELSGATAGAATAAGVASAGSRTDEDTANAGQTRPGSDDAAAATSAAGAQDVPADPEKFVPVERAKSFAARWAEVKGEFVDEPRDAVHKADTLVGEVLDEIAKVFTEHRSRIEHDLDTDGTTEDLRQAMHRYREFFERLLKI